MYLPLLTTLTLLTTTTLATKLAVKNHPSFGTMLARGAALSARQDAGYYPGTTDCGEGNTCKEACGPTQVECASSDPSTLYCHDETDGSQCCPDGSGNSCNKGFYCTSDGKGTTYCCPDGEDTVACAASYSLSVSLVRETGSATFATLPTVSTNTLPAETPITTGLGGAPAPPALPTSSQGGVTGAPNVTFTTGLPSPPPSVGPVPPQFTGGAARVGGAAMAVLAGAVGVARLL